MGGEKIGLCSACRALQAGRKKFGEASGKNCFLCRGEVYGKAKELLRNALGQAKAIEFSSFQAGCSLPDEVLAREERVWEISGVAGAASLKGFLNQMIAGEVKRASNARPEAFEPELLVRVDLVRGKVLFEPQPLFIAGRYLKFSRELAQSKWHCKNCMGRGCGKCGGKGFMYESVEEKIGGILQKESQASGVKFHASGREDVDARMLGDGRPFAIELLKPLKRRLAVGALELLVNSLNKGVVEARELHECGKQFVEMMHNVRLEKSYKALVEVAGEVKGEKILALQKRAPLKVRQWTPERVLHRRSNLERVRRVKRIGVRIVSGNAFELEVEAEAGTYIKEFVSGDKGRTKPNISEMLGVQAKATELDVTGIERLIEDWW